MSVDTLVRIPNIRYYGAREVSYVEDYLSTTEENDFIPIITLNSGELTTIRNTGYKIFSYSLQVPAEDLYRVRKFTDFGSHLLHGGSSWYRIAHSTLIKTYIGTSCTVIYIQDEPFQLVPLMVMTVKRRYLFQLNPRNPNPVHLCLLIDNKFINDEEHFKLYRATKKHCIDTLEKEIDVLYSNNILDLCFKQKELKLPKLTTITEILEHTNSINEIVQQSIMAS